MWTNPSKRRRFPPTRPSQVLAFPASGQKRKVKQPLFQVASRKSFWRICATAKLFQICRLVFATHINGINKYSMTDGEKNPVVEDRLEWQGQLVRQRKPSIASVSYPRLLAGSSFSVMMHGFPRQHYLRKSVKQCCKWFYCCVSELGREVLLRES
ncbi:hypothetical protein BaRGS_00000167 [Batillaria attramentaria]|uniref:Uncharacterized protein n=1 Tax=Batillaria attramentaria TaxID=370345 RepID=A0ABD0MBL2_9CAEN